MELDIGELAKLTKIAPSAIRYYESIGFYQSIRRKGLRRQYAAETIKIIQIIKSTQKCGLTLSDTKHSFFSNKKIQIDRNLLSHKILELNNTINDLIASLGILKHIHECPFIDHLQCPEFNKLINSNVVES